MKNEFIIEMIGNTSEDRKIPLSVAIKTFEGLQNIFYEIGNINLDDSESPLGKGPRSSALKQYCELYLTEAKHGSLYATMELPPSRSDLASELEDFPERIITEFKSIVESITLNDYRGFLQAVKHPSIRRKIISIYNATFPVNNSEYIVNLKFKDNIKIQNVRRIPKDKIDEFVSDKELISVPEREEIKLRADIVTVLNKEGVPDLHKARLISFQAIGDTRPYRASIIRNQSIEIHLNFELVSDVRFDNQYYIIENEEINLCSYGESREEAIEAFNSDFAMLYECYYLEEDTALTRDALKLKEKLKEIIQGGQLIVDDEN